MELHEFQRVPGPAILRFISDVLVASGAAPAHAASVARALTRASLLGTDSHGIRLLVHYAKVIQTGRINPKPKLGFSPTGPGTGIVDADNGFGHHASYHAIERGAELAAGAGIAAISVINSSHFGAAGCYVLEAADRDLVALAFANSDSFVLPHDGVAPFHGTNPIAFAAPVPASPPYFLDMATSAIPWNKVQDLKAKGLELPPNVAVDATGSVTVDPARSAALLPLGGPGFGHKGAGLASMIEIFSAVMTGMAYCTQLLGMVGPDLSTPRRLGHFFILIDPLRFVSKDRYSAAMAGYLEELRSAPAQAGKRVMAPGDREWATEADRMANGIPVAPALVKDFRRIAASMSVVFPQFMPASN